MVGPDKNHAREGGVHKLWRPPCLSRGVPIGRAKKQESIPRLSAPTRAPAFHPDDETTPRARNTPFLADDSGNPVAELSEGKEKRKSLYPVRFARALLMRSCQSCPPDTSRAYCLLRGMCEFSLSIIRRVRFEERISHARNKRLKPGRVFLNGLCRTPEHMYLGCSLMVSHSYVYVGMRRYIKGSGSARASRSFFSLALDAKARSLYAARDNSGVRFFFECRISVHLKYRICVRKEISRECVCILALLISFTRSQLFNCYAIRRGEVTHRYFRLSKASEILFSSRAQMSRARVVKFADADNDVRIDRRVI